jgi:acetoin utilization deacetylase AcuC-like enzyme
LAVRPDIVFFQAGVDALATDKLGRLSLSQEGMRNRDQLVISQARDQGVPLVITLGGGYSEPIEATVDAHAATFLTAAQIFSGGRRTNPNTVHLTIRIRPKISRRQVACRLRGRRL